MTDFRLMRGDDWVRCSICGALHEDPYTDLAIDEYGDRWDVCAGDCAHSAGL